MVLKFNLGRNSEARFGQDFEVEVKARFEAGVWSVFSADVLFESWSKF